MRPADQVWNRAAFASDPADWDPLGPGDRKLAALLALHGLVSNGTVLAAIEDLEAEDLE